MKWLSRIKTNMFFCGDTYFDTQRCLSQVQLPFPLAGTAFVFLSDIIANSINNCLVGNDCLFCCRQNNSFYLDSSVSEAYSIRFNNCLFLETSI